MNETHVPVSFFSSHILVETGWILQFVGKTHHPCLPLMKKNSCLYIYTGRKTDRKTKEILDTRYIKLDVLVGSPIIISLFCSMFVPVRYGLNPIS